MKCPKCKAQLSGSERFCANCGLNLMEWYATEKFDKSEELRQLLEQDDDWEESRQLLEQKDDRETSNEEISSEEKSETEQMASDTYQNPYGEMDFDYDPYKALNKSVREEKESEEDESYLILETEKEEITTIDAISESISDSSEMSSQLPEQKKNENSRILLYVAIGIVLGVGGYLFISGRHDLNNKVQTAQSVVADNTEVEIKKEKISNTADKPENKQTEEITKISDGITDEVTNEDTDAENESAASEEFVPTIEQEETFITENESEPEPAEDEQLSWQAAVSSEEQGELMADGTWLDRNHMKDLMDASAARYGLYVMDLTNFVDYKIGEAETPLPASALIGIPIMYTIAEGISRGAYTMDDPVTFSYTFENGRGEFKAEQNGQQIALGELLKAGLTKSDNNAWNSLMDYLTRDQINMICHQYGYNSVDLQRGITSETTDKENYISACDAARMLNAIYQDNFTTIDKTFLETYFRISPEDTANKGMYPACLNSSLFLNLNGITETRYNEVGLVENGDEIFIMAALTVDGAHETSAPCVTNEAAYVLQNLKVGER